MLGYGNANLTKSGGLSEMSISHIQYFFFGPINRPVRQEVEKFSLPFNGNGILHCDDLFSGFQRHSLYPFTPRFRTYLDRRDSAHRGNPKGLRRTGEVRTIFCSAILWRVETMRFTSSCRSNTSRLDWVRSKLLGSYFEKHQKTNRLMPELGGSIFAPG